LARRIFTSQAWVGAHPLLGPDFHRLDRTSLRLAHLLDHLVSADEQSGWHSKAERLAAFKIDNQLNRRGLLVRQIACMKMSSALAGYVLYCGG
jgi:hypothetical protein